MRNSDQTARASNSDGAFLCAPFFQAPVSNALPLRRLLLISFHFPPGGAAGALRWQKLSRFAGEHTIPWGEIAAAAVIVTIPLAIVVLILQKRIVSGLTAGAVKG